MKYLNKFNESVERDIKNAIDNILLWLKEDGIITYTLTDSNKNRMIGPPPYSLKRIILSIECVDHKNRGGVLMTTDIINEIETIIDFIKTRWGDDFTIKYNNSDGYYYNMKSKLPGSFRGLSIVIEKWK